ncbi:hypothetical protein F4861DRAFT_233165 [Xylaria intraflava]|nr:hypothetical protein F4861DRAFT_233165 [Xylaria intraflava]
MASAIPVANIRGAGEKSRGRRLGALLDLSRGTPPLLVTRKKTQKESEKNAPPASEKPQLQSQSRIQGVRTRPGLSTQQLPTQAEVGTSHSPLAHDVQSWSTSPRSAIPTAKPIMEITGDAEPYKQQRNLLHRKRPSVLQEPSKAQTQNQSRPERGRTDSSSSITKPQTMTNQINSLSDRRTTRSPVESRIAQKSATHSLSTQPARIYPELDRYRDIQVPPSRDRLGRDNLYKLETEDLPPPTPQFSGASSRSQLSSFSTSPSTRFSGSPGPGPYSRDTTPTSMCSQSPSFVAPMRLAAPRVRQASPAETRPPVTRRRTGSLSNDGGSFSSDSQGLAAVREALTSSSSGSTVRAEEKKDSKAHREHALGSPNAPPRKSSQRVNKGRNTNETQSVKLSDIPARPVMRSPSPSKVTGSIHNRPPGLVTSPQHRPTPPSRPSRDKIPDLYTQFGGPVPIVHSNLSPSSPTERRQSGQLQPSSLPRTMTSESVRDRAVSARPSFSREAASAARSGSVSSTQVTKIDAGKLNRAPTPSIPVSKPKFSLFGRRTKSGSEASQAAEKKEKVSRKGPAAGTGHEGYGRFGAVKRRSSTASTLQRGLPGPVSSSESLARVVSTDQFLLERMNPVIIAGGTVVENQNTNFDANNTESASGIARYQHSRKTSAVSPTTKEDSRQTLWPSPPLREPTSSRRPSNNSSLEGTMVKPTVASRRSSRGLLSQDNLSFGIPEPIDTRAPSVASTATTIYTDTSSPGIEPDQERVPSQAEVPAKKLIKRAPRKWNLFGRSQASSSKKQAKSVSAMVEPTQKKPPAFYTMIDSPDQDLVDDKKDADTIRRGADISPIAEVQINFDRRPSTSSSTTQVIHAHTGKEVASSPSKPGNTVSHISQPDMKQDQSSVEQNATEASGNRGKRLPQIGRIPKIATGRLEQTSPRSFSRPFNRTSVQLVPPQPTQPNHDSIAERLTLPELVAPRTIYAESPGSRTGPPHLAVGQTSHGFLSTFEQPGPEFLAFPSRKGSACTESSESKGSDVLGYAAHVAQVPEPSAPLGEDEIWDEFNDFLGESLLSSSLSWGMPFQLDTQNSKLAKKPAKPAKPLESPTISAELIHDVRLSIVTDIASSRQSADVTARIGTALEFDNDLPTTPFSLSEFASDDDDHYGNKTESKRELKAPPLDELSVNEGNKIDFGSKRSSGSSGLSKETPLSQVNLRVGSMTVSKWLTFGHVLFSPIREDLINDKDPLNRQSILVIDGLGNDDWSFYVAETYPSADFYNLSPRAPVPKEQLTPTFPRSPPNHHQIEFPSHADKFPFSPHSFNALVFRFPAAAPEAHYRNIISEARRVLKPGGFIELSVLDVDLNNVGNRTRRAIRQLKEQISVQNPDFYLSSTSDIMLRLLGTAGFVDIKTCRVGVPVASPVTNNSPKNKKKDERSLAEMMNDGTEVGDENITKMVSKIGRWWYNRIYETTGMSSSVWHDRPLLSECEEWGTSLKLMVCHARIPEARGRFASI